jgi:hypothetical protein
MDSKSEVARIKQQISLEYEAAARIFTQPSITSQHDFIEHRQEKLGDYFEELTQHMSPEEAIQIFVQIEKQERKNNV